MNWKAVGMIKGFRERRGAVPHWAIWPLWRPLIAVDDWLWSHLKVGRRVEAINRWLMNTSNFVARPALRALEHADSSRVYLEPCE